MQLTQGIPGGLTYNLGNYTDTPTQDMIWNWVANINAGENVMLNKLNDETTYEDRFTQDTGFYYPTPEQTEMNVWQRYNGGIYYKFGCQDANGNTYFYSIQNGVPTIPNICFTENLPFDWFKNPILNQKEYVKCTINGIGYPYAYCVNNIAAQHPDWCQ
ncbi:MAG: hypothetical protein M1591_05140 [Deltaproteobacteria bacterium]|nr:hypothetical protein [Deltaproteobacteria bacterium]